MRTPTFGKSVVERFASWSGAVTCSAFDAAHMTAGLDGPSAVFSYATEAEERVTSWIMFFFTAARLRSC
jgi:hypothetical protein